ncbi:NADP-dependent oxidoreductase [Streptomyces sp. NPDC008163]|uniref:NADP-dependent oxidoreductase n=1 Tax=Streptomyces sp. NPDC008163 TaxID=3364818 RepID=UPI0036E73B17
MSGVPEIMRAILLDGYGPAERLRPAELRVPRPREGEILVRVHAAGVNPIDWETRSGRGVPIDRFPAVLGWDISGTVVAVGPGVVDKAENDQVFGMLRFPALSGGYAQYVVASASDLALKPSGVSHTVAAASALPVLTAWQTLFEQAGRSLAGARVLVHGAAGGVGQVAVQLAKRAGAEVIATASARNHGHLAELGADRLLDYTREPIEEKAVGIDVAVDPRGGAEFGRVAATVRPGGTLVTLKGEQCGQAEVAAARGIRIGRTKVRPDAGVLGRAAALLESGALRTEIAAVLSLDQAAAAHELGERGGVRGRITLDAL